MRNFSGTDKYAVRVISARILLVSAIVVIFCICATLSLDLAYADTVTSANGKTSYETQGKLIKKKGSATYKYKKVVKRIEPSSGKTVKKTIGGTKTAKNVFLTRGKKGYYFASDGKMVKGWTKIKSDYYYFDRSTGVQKRGSKKKPAKVDGITIKRNGKAVNSTYNINKIKTMMKARKVMLANTKWNDSKSSKRYKMFRWVMAGQYRQFRTLRSTGHKKGWELLFANDMFDKGRLGCCVSNACAFAYLAKECGYTNVRICDDTGHAFVTIDGRYYDTLFAETSGFSNYYNASHASARKDGIRNSLKI